jgi:hypothetical protein
MCGTRRFRRPRNPGADLARDERRGPAVTSRVAASLAIISNRSALVNPRKCDYNNQRCQYR